MIKRLSISLLLMGLAVFSLGAAAFAWFSDSGSGDVTISSGTVDLEFRVDIDCNGGPEDGFDTPWSDFDADPMEFGWSNIVPGDTTADCIEVRNSGDGELTVYASHGNFDGDPALRNQTRWQYNAIGTGSVNCGFSTPHHSQYTSGRGCELDTIGPSQSFDLKVDVEFLDSGSNQDDLQDTSFSFDSALTGYTG